MLHAWEVGAPDSLCGEVRKRLETAGADAEAQRQVPRTLIFMVAAEGPKRRLKEIGERATDRSKAEEEQERFRWGRRAGGGR